MSSYNEYPWHKVLLRRIGAVTLGVIAFPVMIFRQDRGRFYSYLYRVWAKTSNKPVWLARSDLAVAIKNH